MPSHPLEFELMLAAAILLLALLIFAMMLLVVIVKLILENQAKSPYKFKYRFYLLRRHPSPPQEDIGAKAETRTIDLLALDQ